MAARPTSRKQDVPFQLRMTAADRRYLEAGAKALSARSPVPVGLGPFLVWAAKQSTEQLLDVSQEEFEKAQTATGSGPKRKDGR